MSLTGMLKQRGPNGFGYGSTAEQVTQELSLAGKTVLITGCNSGLGFETMRVLALRGARVLGTARTRARAAEACRSVSGDTTALACELADPESVRGCVRQIVDCGVRLDAIIANAGIMRPPRRQTVCGYEQQFFINHVAHFMLVTGLMDVMSEAGRVVMVSSSAHHRAPACGIEFDNLDASNGYSPWSAYGQSKLANILFAKELARRWVATGKTANACHPGIINTNLSRHLGSVRRRVAGVVGEALFFKSIAQGAATQCYLAASPAVAGVSGKYFADCNQAQCRADGDDAELAGMLWRRTEEIIKTLPA